MKKLGRRLLIGVAVVIGILLLGFVVLGLLPVSADPVLAADQIVVGAQIRAEGHNLPTDFPAVSAVYTPEQQALGRLLFFDPVLSGKQTMSCATCHHPDLGFSNGKPTGIGSDDKPLARNVPTLYEVVYKASLFWDGRASSLEDQMHIPLTAANEMAGDPAKIVADLKALPEYQALFAKAFPNQSDAVSFDNVKAALAAFERGLIAHNSPFDRYAAGESSALTPSQRRGLALFRSGATRCYNCHTMPAFTNGEYAVTGVPSADGKLDDTGRGAISGVEGDNYAFMVPTLRNVALSAPYMHNGSLATLDDVIAFYMKGGGQGMNLTVPNQSRSVFAFELSDQERRDLVDFLYSLTDESTKPTIPDRVPSGLPVVQAAENPATAAIKAINTAGSAAVQREPKTLTVSPDVTIQSVVDQAVAGDTIEIQYGVYHEPVIIDLASITLRGIPNASGEFPVLDGENKYTDGIVASGDNFLVEKLAVKNYRGNGIIVDGVTGVTFRDIYVENMSLYGVYPVHCTNVLVERVRATKVADAGIYVGQSRDIVVRDNEAWGNVVGIEVENSVNAEVYGNHAHDNTAGISIHLLPTLPSKVSQHTKVYDNIVENNNLANFGRPGSVVAMVPKGTGIIVFGSDDVELYRNTIRGNTTGGVGVFSTAVFFEPEQLDVGPAPERVRLHDNTFKDNGNDPDKILKDLGVSGGDVIWDASNWDNTFDDAGITSFPPVLPSSNWAILTRKAYWQVVNFAATRLF